MIIKGLNYTFKQFSPKVFYTFCRNGGSNFDKTSAQSNTILGPSQILQIAVKDSQNNFKNYRHVLQNFQKSLKSEVYLLKSCHQSGIRSHQQILKQTLSIVSTYPLFELDNQSLKLFYKLASQNMHQKDNELLEQFLIFAIMVDSNAGSSPVFGQFIKFYLQNFIELLRAQLSIDLREQDVISTIKLFFFRIFQRGFLPRTPSYFRQLYVSKHIQLLNKMVQNPKLSSSLLVKKVHFQYFTNEVKYFYQREMGQNLYHFKNLILLHRLADILPFLCKSYQKKIVSIEHQAKYSIQLYVKLFLAVEYAPLKNAIFLYNLIKKEQARNPDKRSVFKVQKQQNNPQQPEKKSPQPIRQAFVSKAKRIFQGLKQQNQSMRQLGTEGEKNFQMDVNGLKTRGFRLEEIIMILLQCQALQLDTGTVKWLLNEFSFKLSAIFFKKYFGQIVQLLILHDRSYKSLFQSTLLDNFAQESIYSELQLRQIAQFSFVNLVQRNIEIKKRLIQSILSKEIQKICNSQLLDLLAVYHNTQKGQIGIHDEQHESKRQALINFVLRFIADHYKRLPFDLQFQNILLQLFDGTSSGQTAFRNKASRNIKLSNKSFNDHENNYPQTIEQQLAEHLKKNTWRIKSVNLKQKLIQLYDI